MREWNENEIAFLKSNHGKKSYREIGKILDRSQSSVENKAHKIGLKGERKHICNSDFFKFPLNEFSAYWLGFIYADGYVAKKELAIQLQKEDYEHLKKFNKCLEGNIPVTFFEKEPRYIKGKLAKKSYLCAIRIYNQKIKNDLFLLGVHPNKSLTIRFPKLENDSLTWNFIRGYFDGDGSVYYDANKNMLLAKITCGSPEFIKDFRLFLDKYNIKTYLSKNNLDCGITGKESYILFFSFLYGNANIYLDRKYYKYQKYKHLLGFNKQ